MLWFDYPSEKCLHVFLALGITCHWYDPIYNIHITNIRHFTLNPYRPSFNIAVGPIDIPCPFLLLAFLFSVKKAARWRHASRNCQISPQIELGQKPNILCEWESSSEEFSCIQYIYIYIGGIVPMSEGDEGPVMTKNICLETGGDPI